MNFIACRVNIKQTELLPLACTERNSGGGGGGGGGDYCREEDLKSH